MFSRSLMSLSLGVALALGTPVASFAQQAKKPQATESTAKPAAKKRVAKKPAAGKKAAARSKKGRSAKPEAEVVEEKPKGLLASLFGAPKAKTDRSARGAAKPARPDARAAARKADERERPARTGLRLFGSAEPASEPRPAGRLRPLNPISPVESAAMSAGASEVVVRGNNGELRSGNVASGGLMASLFGAEDQYLPETRALDDAMRSRATRKKGFQVAEKWQPQVVSFSGYPRGTIVIDTANHFLYLVEGRGSARRYGIAVGKDGLQYKGSVRVGDKQEWPRWIPTKEMQERNPKEYGKYKDGMPGGGMNPLGARAIYLYAGKKDTHLRIHGTIAPQTIGTNSSNGCFRMVNDHVIDLYRRVPVGANVVVL